MPIAAMLNPVQREFTLPSGWQIKGYLVSWTDKEYRTCQDLHTSYQSISGYGTEIY